MFKANFCWMDAFPLTRPFQLGHHCEFHVLHKDVEPLNTSDALLDPPDADHSYNAMEDDDDSENIEVQDPTHFSQLDPKAMKIIDLRKELEARTLSSKGMKSQLIARLTKSLKMEQEKEESEEQVKEDVPSPMEEEVQKNLEEEKSEEKKKEI